MQRLTLAFLFILCAGFNGGAAANDACDPCADIQTEVYAARQLATIQDYIKSGHKFTDRQDGMGRTAGISAALAGPDVFEAYLKGGGPISDKMDSIGFTMAIAVVRDKKEIELYAAAGGKFTDQQTTDAGMTGGMTASMTALRAPENVEAFAKAGGHYTNQQDMLGRDAGIIAVQTSPEVIRAFAKAGGKFTDQQDVNGRTAADWAQEKSAKSVEAYNDAIKHQGGLVFIRRKQIGQTDDTAPDCSRHDLDTSFDIMDSPDHYRTLSLNFRNKADYACALRYRNSPHAGTSRLMEFSLEGNSPPKILPEPFVLNPGKTAHISIRWATEPVAGKTCRQGNEIWVFMSKRDPGTVSSNYPVTPYFDISFLSDTMGFCSDAVVSPYMDGPAQSILFPKGNSNLHFDLSQDVITHYVGDPLKLKLDVTDPDKLLPVKIDAQTPKDACADMKLFQTTRWPGGAVTVEELNDGRDDEFECKVRDAADNRQIELTFQKRAYGPQHSGVSDMSEGDQTIGISYISAGMDTWKTVATSNDLDMHMAKLSSIEPAWGESANGFVVSLKLDKEIYHVDSNILLHIACSRLTDDWKISDNAFTVHQHACDPDIEVRDGNGSLVKFEDRRDIGNGYFTMCLEGGSNPGIETLNIEKGVIETKELTLNKDCIGRGAGQMKGFFISRPGTYTATAIWHAHSESPEVNVEVRSKPVTFRIVGN